MSIESKSLPSPTVPRRGRVDHRRLSSAFALALVAQLLHVSCGQPEEERNRNLLLITIDTLRADHLGVYGYERETSPNIDRFAERAVVFDSAYSTSSWTLPSLASLMTSQLATTHACLKNDSRLSDSFVTLAEQLGAAGYWSGAVTTHVFVGRKYGLDQGFSVYDDELVTETLRDSNKAITSPRVTEKGLRFLEERAADPATPWFVWLHYFDPHSVYMAHEKSVDGFGRELPVDRYDAEIAFTDAHVGRVLDALRALELEQDTVVVIAADHGEEFGDHGGTGHRRTLYDEVIRIPLLIGSPDLGAGRVSAPVPCVDILPTALELVDIAGPGPIAGRSLVPAMRGEELPARAILSELGRNHLESLVDGNWKLVRARRGPGPQLFDLAADPAEQNDLAAEQPERVQAMLIGLEALKKHSSIMGAGFGERESVHLSEQEQETLRELGYAGDD